MRTTEEISGRIERLGGLLRDAVNESTRKHGPGMCGAAEAVNIASFAGMIGALKWVAGGDYEEIRACLNPINAVVPDRHAGTN
jgi:hypothetical protein